MEEQEEQIKKPKKEKYIIDDDIDLDNMDNLIDENYIE